MARKKGGRIPVKSQGKTSVVPMRKVPMPPRMASK